MADMTAPATPPADDAAAGEVCPICREDYEDPVMCADGYCYCRRCIGQWVGTNQEWRSPLTGQTLVGPALLTPDLLRAGIARKARRGRAASLPPGERLLWTATARCGNVFLADAGVCSAVLDEALSSIGLPDAAIYCILELCWRSGRVRDFPPEWVEVDRIIAKRTLDPREAMAIGLPSAASWLGVSGDPI